jgi:phage tail sheath protein FI
MWFARDVPGVYNKEDWIRPGPRLPTGVPCFVGFLPRAAGLPDAPVALHRQDDFNVELRKRSWAGLLGAKSYLAAAVNGFFLNEGGRCYVAYAALDGPDAAALEKALAEPDALAAVKKALADAGPESVAAVRKALAGSGSLSDVDLIAVPDASLLTNAAAVGVQQAALEHCREHAGRMAILDVLPVEEKDAAKRQTAAVKAVKEQSAALAAGAAEPENGALYYPWIKTYEGTFVPPCGHVAGIFSRSDARVGVFKAPANEEVKGALDLEFRVDDATQGELNPKGVNCLRAFKGRGIRVWGARTLSPGSEWRYVNVRRLFLTLRRWIDLNMGWAGFEPNTPELWVRIERELGSYLFDLWNAGALAGQTAEEAFYIKCDAETNPPQAEDAGQVITEIGLAASAPAEYVVVRVVHHTGVAPR